MKNNFKKLYNVPNTPSFLYMNELKLKKYIDETELKLSRKKTAKILLKIRDYYDSICDTRSVSIMNIIIGNTKYHDRIVFIWDGSYRTHRVWIDNHDMGISVDYSDDFSSEHYYRKMFPVVKNYDGSVKALKHIFGNYEKIFIQIPYKEWNELKALNKSGF